MMKNIYLLSSLFFALCSCQTPRYIYTPSPPNINYFKQKGDAKLTTVYSSGDQNGPNGYNNGFDIQSGYALTNHFALLGSFYYRSDKDNFYGRYNYSNTINDTASVSYKRHFFELGAGYFLPLNKKRTVTYNIYGGIALGAFSISEYDNLNNTISKYNYKNNMSKLFLQSGLNFMLSPYINFSFTDRLMSIHYGYGDSSLFTGYSYYDLNGKNLTAFEHTVNFQFGIPAVKWIKIDASFTSCFIDQKENLKTRPYNGSIGLSFDLSKIKKSKK